MFASIAAISAGAALGALLRWFLALQLNTFFPTVPLGTLVANLGGGYMIGLAVAVFGQWPGIPAEWRLFVITGFLGGLTTFSTFSAEVTTLLQNGRFGWAVGAVAAHVIGSLVMTILGMATVALVAGWPRHT
ncbi:fluoride ion transporter CrcB [Pandoraea terrae]|uniref:Fluoride-specific ion channel FluC n=1 Tax=Pandoraea terrae TaxID=1537710 RepID=A0A5E4YAW3_9BURK|nr:fluoride efflux transporter CrcB [Pandoraea terrae]VVE45343.1 fluoride ion transporter CrcB [Pandoraea terrae]